MYNPFCTKLRAKALMLLNDAGDGDDYPYFAPSSLFPLDKVEESSIARLGARSIKYIITSGARYIRRRWCASMINRDTRRSVTSSNMCAHCNNNESTRGIYNIADGLISTNYCGINSLACTSTSGVYVYSLSLSHARGR